MIGISEISAVVMDLPRAGAKWTAARLRAWKKLPVYENWAARAIICETCPLRRVKGGVSYCGVPYIQQPIRQPHEGCGCPTHSKAKDPTEHCPLNWQHLVASRTDGQCDCKWCKMQKI